MTVTTKFKYNDKVRLLGHNLEGELIDIKPLGIFNGRPMYKYVMFTIQKGVLLVEENQLELVERAEE